MSLVPSLLQAIITTEGEALVLHVGEKPYVVTLTGQVDLATKGLTFDAVNGIVNQLLPLESQRALDEFGAAQYELPPILEFPGENFTIVAARGGDDLWAEIRRKRVAFEDEVPMDLFASTSSGSGSIPSHAQLVADDGLEVPGAAQLWSGEGTASPAGKTAQASTPTSPPALRPPPVVAPPPPAHQVSQPPVRPQVPSTLPAPAARSALPLIPPPARNATAEAVANVTARLQGSPPPPAVPTPAPIAREVAAPAPAPPKPPVAPPPVQRPTMVAPPPSPIPAAPAPDPRQLLAASDPAAPGVVLPLSRSPIRPDAPAPLVADALAGLDRLLRLAAARGASTLYLSSSSRPTIRVDGSVQTIDGVPVLGPNDVESLMLTLMPERNAEALRRGVETEWICDVPEVGRVRCLSFRDNRGPGGVFRMMPVRTVTADQLGLSREVQALAIEPEGLVLVAGPRSSGKRTLMSALVDLINRTRRDHVITIETEINVVHERIGSLVSQREVRGGHDEMLASARAALREDPDVLMLEDVRTAGLMSLALDAAASGQLVIGGFPAHNASGAVDRIIDLYTPEYRRQMQVSLAQNLRGVVAQVLLRKISGGRVAAREVLLNTPAVRGVLAEGRTSQLPLVIEGGRPYGMVPLNDALVGFVQSGAVDVREAYWRAVDRAGFLALLKRQGIDTSLIERQA